MVNALIPDDAETPRRRMQSVQVAMEDTNATDVEEPLPQGGDLPDPNETGNQGFLRKAGMSADEFCTKQLAVVGSNDSYSGADSHCVVCCTLC
jgi:hypothetical protein